MTANAVKRHVVQDQIPRLVRTNLVPTAVWVVGDLDQVPGPLQVPNLISLEGNDVLYLLVDVVLVSAEARMRVEFSHTADNATAADWYVHSALEPAALAAGVISVGVGTMFYSFTVSGKYRIPIILDDKAVRVSVLAPAPNAADRVAIRALRRIRDSLVSG